VQPVVHAVPAALHMFGAQLAVAGLGVTQVPVPLHVSVKTSVVPLHETGLHTVPLGYSAHAAPLHDPLVPQELAAVVAHWLLGSVPVVTVLHVPLAAPVSAFEQARQVPVHAVLQQ
jgi:hypothetical protein